MPSPKPRKTPSIHFVQGPGDLEKIPESLRALKKKRRKKIQPASLSPAFEVPAELLAAKQKLIDEVFGGYSEWEKAHDEGRQGAKLGLENVTGIYIGQKRTGRGKGKPTPHLCVVVEVATKADKARLNKNFRIPETIQVGDTYVLTDVQVAKKIKPQGAVGGGDSCGLERPTPKGYERGTLGCFCTILDDDGERWGCLLTNSHVIGDFLGAGVQANDEIHHPSGPNGRRIGYYLKSGPADVDAALAFTSKSAVDLTKHHLEIAPGLGDPTSGDTVLTYGAMTGEVREGVVVQTGMEKMVQYTVGNRVIRDAFTIKPRFGGSPFSQAGDSGSLITDAGTDQAVGLLIGGEGALTVAQRLHYVCDRLDIEEILSTE